MKLTRKLYESTYTRYSTDIPNVEYTGLSESKLDLLLSVNTTKLLNKVEAKGFSHEPYKKLPFNIHIRTRLPEKLRQLFDKDLTHPIIEFEYKGHTVDMQILQSLNILRMEDLFYLSDACSKIADVVGEGELIKPVFSYTETGDLALYVIP